MTWLVAPLSSIPLPDLWTPTGSPGGPRLRRAWRVVPAGIVVFPFIFFWVFFSFRAATLGTGSLGARPRWALRSGVWAPAGWGLLQDSRTGWGLLQDWGLEPGAKA